MKKILLMVAAVCLFGCASKEKKALKLIDKEMFSTLYDYDSYQPVEIKIDSAFTSIYMDSTIRVHAAKIIAILSLLEESKKNVDEALSTAQIWQDSYSAYGRQKFLTAKEKASKCIEEMEASIKLWGESKDTITMHAKAFNPEFQGWQATHKFRCKSKGGSSLLSTHIYVFDPKMKQILYSYDTEDEDLTKAHDIIDQALAQTE